MIAYVKFERLKKNRISAAFSSRLWKPAGEGFYISDKVGIRFTIPLYNEPDNLLPLKLLKLSKALEEYRDVKCVLSDNTYAQYAQNAGLYIAPPYEYIKRNADKILLHIASRGDILHGDAVCVIYDPSGENLSEQLLFAAYRSAKNLCIISENEEAAESAADEFYELTGIPALYGSGGALSRCDIVVSFGDPSALVSKGVYRKAMIIDVSGGKSRPSEGNTIVIGFVPKAPSMDKDISPQTRLELFSAANVTDFKIERLIYQKNASR